MNFKEKHHKEAAGFLLGALLPVVVAGFLLSVQGQDIRFLLDGVAARLESFPKYESWKFRSASTRLEMDKNWKPKKTTVIEKLVNIAGRETNEEYIKVTETKDGKTKDITHEYARKAREEREKARKEREERARKKGAKDQDGSDNRRNLSLALSDLFPFKEGKRDGFDFILHEDADHGGRPVFVLNSKAKVKADGVMEGKYYIAKEDFTVLKAELKPAKFPKMVKEFGLEMTFEVLPGGHFVAKKMMMRVNGGIFIKSVRIEVEEEYSGYEILN